MHRKGQLPGTRRVNLSLVVVRFSCRIAAPTGGSKYVRMLCGWHVFSIMVLDGSYRGLIGMPPGIEEASSRSQPACQALTGALRGTARQSPIDAANSVLMGGYAGWLRRGLRAEFLWIHGLCQGCSANINVNI